MGVAAVCYLGWLSLVSLVSVSVLAKVEELRLVVVTIVVDVVVMVVKGVVVEGMLAMCLVAGWWLVGLPVECHRAGAECVVDVAAGRSWREGVEIALGVAVIVTGT